MSVRRAYNLVRQGEPSAQRLTFEEYSILCHLEAASDPVKTSDIAEYQGALRPTMTHRTNHLFKLGLIDRGTSPLDRRNIVCGISETGRRYVEDISQRVCESIPAGQALARTNGARVRKYVDAMGSIYCTAGDLVLLGLHSSDGPCTIMRLVDLLGLLQPTVSMSVTTLEEDGLVRRQRPKDVPSRTIDVVLTDIGVEESLALEAVIGELVVRRRPRRVASRDAERA